MTNELEPFISILGWTLLNSIWQSGVIAFATWLLFRIENKVFSTETRYYISVIAMLGVIVWSINTAWTNVGSIQSGLNDVSTSSGFAMSIDFQNIESSFSFTALLDIMDRYLDYFVWIWFAGFIIFAMRMAGGIGHLRRIRRTSFPLNELTNLVDKFCVKMNVKIKVQIGESSKIKAPVVIGHIKPIILCPVGFVTGLPIDQIEMVIAHELAHIRRNDFLVNILQKIVESIYFFNPFIWWISSQIGIEREAVCDDEVVKLTTDSKTYTEALLSTYKYANSAPYFGIGITGSGKNKLLNRIKRITINKMENRSNSNLVPAFLLVLFIAGIIWMQNKNQFSKDPILVTEASFSQFIENNPEVVPVGYHVEGINRSAWLKTFPKIERQLNSDKVVVPIEALAKVEEEVEVNSITEIQELPTVPQFSFDVDTVPPPPHHFKDMGKAMKHLEFMEQQIAKSLQQIEQMDWQMEEFAEQIRKQFQNMEFDLDLDIDPVFDFDFDMDLEQFEREQEEFREQFEDLQGEWQAQLKDQMRELSESLKNLPDMEQEFKRMEEEIKEDTKHLREFEAALKEELVKDGYISENEEVDIIFNDEEIKINGENIIKKDLEKYQKIRMKYFPSDEGRFRYRE